MLTERQMVLPVRAKIYKVGKVTIFIDVENFIMEIQFPAVNMEEKSEQVTSTLSHYYCNHE